MDHPRPLATDTYLPYMRDVVRCEQALSELNVMWRMIEASARMNCAKEAAAILPTLTATRDGFKQLERELVASLVREKVQTQHEELATRAHYVIDIVVRNLYERTADVGFLAIDDELCLFVARGGHASQARARLRAYRSKYTVYDEILLLDTRGNVLVQTDPASPVEGSSDPLIAQTLASESYVETFRYSDLRPTKRKSLIYSRRMLDPQTGVPVGVLCLCFNFEEEMAGIFAQHGDPSGRSIVLLVDGDRRVLASGDPHWIRPGSQVPAVAAGEPSLVMYAGRQYLVCGFHAAGYQGYPGPAGWQGLVMAPLDAAFGGAGGQHVAALAPTMRDGLLEHAERFCPPLFDILGASQNIRRVVWNGQIMAVRQGGRSDNLRVVLDQINETGQRSDELFAESIGDLYDTALAARKAKGGFLSHLLVDLFDRNLYERANDCRWWALTPLLRQLLAQPERDWESLDQISAMLDFINRLYTVYTRIFVYDDQGVILASSHDSLDDSIVGLHIGADMLDRVRCLIGDQAYAVTPFEPSTLYGERHTYVYHAAVRDPADPLTLVGGIGIVFDAENEFAAMLNGSQANAPGRTSLLLNRDGVVISSTDYGVAVGASIELEPWVRGLPCGATEVRVVHHLGQYAVMAASAGSGYREFKNGDAYRDDVLALVIDSLGPADLQRRVAQSSLALGAALRHHSGPEYATFHVDGELFAMTADGIERALPGKLLAPLSMGRRAERAGVVPIGDAASGQRYAWVFDLRYLVSGVPSRPTPDAQIIIVTHGGQTVGLLVGALDAVVRIDPRALTPTPFSDGTDIRLVPQVIRSAGDGLVQVVNVWYLFSRLFDAGEALPEQESAEADDVGL